MPRTAKFSYPICSLSLQACRQSSHFGLSCFLFQNYRCLSEILMMLIRSRLTMWVGVWFLESLNLLHAKRPSQKNGSMVLSHSIHGYSCCFYVFMGKVRISGLFPGSRLAREYLQTMSNSEGQKGMGNIWIGLETPGGFHILMISVTETHGFLTETHPACRSNDRAPGARCSAVGPGDGRAAEPKCLGGRRLDWKGSAGSSIF